MKTLFLSSLIVFCILIAYLNKRHSRMEEKFQKDFWDREALANSTRKKSLANLPYITIPFDTLPMETMKANEKITELHNMLQNLSEQPIVNFTGYTNTDLKLEYGTANITCLSEYDQSYTLLARTLQEWAEYLYEAGFIADARTVLEFAISTRTDVSRSYYLLADIYDAENEPEKKAALLETAQSLRSAMKNAIVRTLQQSGPYSG